MTAQIENKICYEGKSFSVICREKDWPLKPEKYGLKLQAPCTACWRGYVCDYVIKENTLLLDNLEINSNSTESISINGVMPSNIGSHAFFNWSYKNLALPIRYTGGLVLGADPFCRNDPYIGYHRSFCYETVLEFLFHEGTVINIFDYSKDLANYRIHKERSNRTYELDNLPPLFQQEYSDNQSWI